VPFFVYAATLAVAGSIAMGYLSRTHVAGDAGDADGGPQRTTFRQALRQPAYRTALVVNAGTGWAQYGVRSSLIPLFVVEGLHEGTLWTGIGLFVGSIAQVTTLGPAGRLADRAGRRPAMVAGGLIGVAGLALLAAYESVPTFLVAMALYGLAAALLSVAPAAIVGDVVSGRGGTVVAAFGMASDLGTVAGPLVAGALADRASYSAAFAATAAVLALGVAMSVRMPETLQRRANSTVAPDAA
jgi:MFS family permease